MQFLTTALLAVTALAAAVIAADNTLNPLIFPSAGDQITAGAPCQIKWTPTSTDKTVTLVLREGDSGALDTLGPIITTENDGAYTWQVPGDLPAGGQYAIQIVYADGSNYSPQFEILSDVTATTSTTAAATTSTTSTTTSAPETSTIETSTTETSTSTTEPPTTDAVTTTTTEAPTSSGSATTLLTSTVGTTKGANTTTTTVKSTSVRPTGTGAPDAKSEAGMGRMVSAGVVGLVVGGWALMF